MTTLAGRHVRLEPLRPPHLPGLLAAATESRDSYDLTWVPGDAGSMLVYIQQALTGPEAQAFAAIRISDDTIVGSTRLHDFVRWSGRAAPDAVEIGHTWYSRSAQRTPVNAEAKLLLLTQAFEAWQVVRVSLKTDARNERSRAAIARLGARFDGVLRATNLTWDGTVRDTAYFSILAAEWPDVRTGLQARLAR
ncbi:MAG: GNAT family N-acetyltransferase [Mycobacteriales bacterium]